MANIGAVILAAGESSRLGQPKQLVQFQGKTLLRHTIDEATQAGCGPIVVVIGSERNEISHELKSSDVVVVENTHWRSGIGTSIRAGVCTLIDCFDSNSKRFLHFGRNDKDASTLPFVDALVLLVCDQPFVDRDVIRSLIALRKKTDKPIVASSYAGTVGVPALFDRVCFPELLALADNTGAKPIILASRERAADLSFADVSCDIDTIADYEMLQKWRKFSTCE